MARLAHQGGVGRINPARIYEILHETPCAYRDCPDLRLVHNERVYDFCLKHLLRIDRKIGLAPGVIAGLANIAAPTEARPDVKSPGVVYFMLIGDEVKIGFTTNLKQRARELKADRVLAYFPGTRDDEITAHLAFAEWNLHGEYFAATPECLASIWRLTGASLVA